VRGMRSSFLADADYHHLTQCETLDDVRLNLTESDYADSVADFNSITPNSLQKVAVEKVCVCCIRSLASMVEPWLVDRNSSPNDNFLRVFGTVVAYKTG
jgi:V-type H+-transporting ATPase subunit d